MARERRRLLISPDRLAERVVLSAAERHYLTRVLRLSAGQGCDVVDGAGRRWEARLTGEGNLALEQPLAAPLEAQPPPAPRLELAVAIPRQDIEVVWRMASELGIDQLRPLVAERCQRRERWPLERWRAIVREASEQCERLWLPELEEPVEATAWLAAPGGTGPVAPGAALQLLASSRGDQRPLLPEWLGSLTSSCAKPMAVSPAGAPSAKEAGPAVVRLAIGPEGGWSPAEEETARAGGWIAVSAGHTILRTSTAAVAGATWLAGWRAGLSSSACPWRSP